MMDLVVVVENDFGIDVDNQNDNPFEALSDFMRNAFVYYSKSDFFGFILSC